MALALWAALPQRRLLEGARGLGSAGVEVVICVRAGQQQRCAYRSGRIMLRISRNETGRPWPPHRSLEYDARFFYLSTPTYSLQTSMPLVPAFGNVAVI